MEGCRHETEMKHFCKQRRQKHIGKTGKKEKCRNAKETKHQLWSPHFSCFICCESSEECEASEKKTQKERQIKKMLLLLLTSYYSLRKNTLSHLKPNCVIVIILYLRLHTREAKES